MTLPSHYLCPKCNEPYFIKDDDGCFQHRTKNPFKFDNRTGTWSNNY